MISKIVYTIIRKTQLIKYIILSGIPGGKLILAIRFFRFQIRKLKNKILFLLFFVIRTQKLVNIGQLQMRLKTILNFMLFTNDPKSQNLDKPQFRKKEFYAQKSICAPKLCKHSRSKQSRRTNLLLICI